MSAASYYNKAGAQVDDHQPGPMHSGNAGHNQDSQDRVHEQQQQRGPQQGFSGQGEHGIYNGQEPQMGNSNYAQGAQQMNGNSNYAQGPQQMNGNGNYAQGPQQTGGQGQGAQGAVADDRDTLTKCNDNPPDYKKEESIYAAWIVLLLQCPELHSCAFPCC